MILQKRNETTFYYANPTGEYDLILDENGYRTGEKRIRYGAPIKMRGNISPATGSVSIEQFGSVEAYDKVIVLSDPTTGITMNSVFWIDQMPAGDDEGLEPGESLEPSESLMPSGTEQEYIPYDYIIGHVSRSLNHMSVAVKAVDVK